ncbi:MAG: DUF805 domain-containing protein [Chloroflexota bacterium]|nr:DUF805 domain-containing protein [Chloroflexota bacterium]
MQQGAFPQTRPMMTIQESVKTCIRKYADFSGRATRAEFWWWLLATTLTSLAISAVDSFVGAISNAYFYSPLSTIFALAVLLPDLAVTARRLHDTGKSGWWQLVWVVVAILAVAPAVVGVVAGLAGLFSAGQDWDNWWANVSWLPIVAGIIVTLLIWIGIFVWWLVWMVKQGQSGPNHYGPDPRAWDDEAIA